jgi:hypothetical protein
VSTPKVRRSIVTRAPKTFYGPPDYGVTIWPFAGKWTITIAWSERGERHSATCGHKHGSRDTARRCANVWRGRVMRVIDGAE